MEFYAGVLFVFVVGGLAYVAWKKREERKAGGGINQDEKVSKE